MCVLIYCVDLAIQPSALLFRSPSHLTTSEPGSGQITEQAPQPFNINIIINFPALSTLQTQRHETQSSLATHVEKVHALEGAIAEHDTIKCEIELSRQLVQKSAALSDEEREKGGFRVPGGVGRMVMMGGVSVLPSRISWIASRTTMRRMRR